MIEKKVKRFKLGQVDTIKDDLAYWLSRPPEERIAAVEMLRKQYFEVSAKGGVLAGIEEAKEMKPEAYMGIPRTSFSSPTKSPVKRTLLQRPHHGSIGRIKELLELLNERSVDYVVVGGYALAHHGAPRFTGDLDILVNPDAANARKVIRVLDEFGFESLGLTADDFEAEDTVIQLGVPPVRIDILTSLTGVSWEQVSSGSIRADLGGVPVQVIGREQLIANKKALGRKRDLADLEAIGAL